ncbi:MAG: zinc metalloprotease HtpX [Candidatus Methanomethylophilaceae archaeon]|nr:zinc metalloprotease HtpX [Candidatus Methanomethylophilaceae archaeon]
MRNTLRTIGLFGFMILLFSALGWILGSVFWDNWVLGMSVFFVIAVAMNFISYFYSKKIVLMSYRVKLVSESEAPRLYKTVYNLAMMNNLPMPEVGIIESATPNAFATGRNPRNAAVVATTGLLGMLSDDELQGVLAHELAHVQNRDILVMTIAATLAGAISFAARFVFYGSMFGGGRSDNPAQLAILMLAAITAPLAALMVQMGISRNREFKADATGARMINNPQALARALEKLEMGNARRPMEHGNPSSAHMFIINPFRGSTLASLFSTHPPIRERIRRLEEMERDMVYRRI